MSSDLVVSQGHAAALVMSLQAAAEKLEHEEHPAWIDVARALALLEGLRIGAVVLEPHPFSRMREVMHA